MLDGDEMSGPEYTYCELPFIEQLKGLGWHAIEGSLDDPAVTLRESFRDVLLLPDLADALRRINLRDGEPWLDQGRIAQSVAALTRIAAPNLLEANETATEALLKGTVVDGLPGWDKGRGQTVQFIDWQKPENNTFRVINQFRVDEPGGQAHSFIVPDLVLFVNGIPLAVVECKSPSVPEPMDQAIDQLQRYSNQRDWVEEDEGNERLFHTNQVLIATSFDEARAATITSHAEHYLEWKDTSPVPTAKAAAELVKDHLSSQETLVAGLLRPAHLLDFVRHFSLFMDVGGKRIKVAARYPQFRAVQTAMRRLKTGKTLAQDGELDRRGGFIWHTQGSGKGLTMVFLVRKMRSDPLLRQFKVVVVTDRKDLQKQLRDTAEFSGEPVRVASSIQDLKKLLAEKGASLDFATIQKYQEHSDDTNEEDSGRPKAPGADFEPLPVLNTDESVLVMVDEAHRSHTDRLHASLLHSLPNCAKIGFTGTPIIMGHKKRTYEIFGDEIDRYTLRQAELDGSIVPILYEGRTAEGAVADGRTLDELFEDMSRDRTEAEKEAIRKKYGTKGNVLEAPALIAAKAKDMLRHYVENILPNGFKAQVVAVSRRATLRYREAFLAAREALVKELEGLNPRLLMLSDEETGRLDRDTQYLVRAHRWLTVLRELEFAPVISGRTNEGPEYGEWTDRSKIETRITRFKKPLLNDDPTKRDPLAFLIVKAMLITGFDAPVEQVMYLDRNIKEADLLQAIARVNRVAGPKKQAGLVVDYYGVTRHLKEALAVYAAEDVEGSMQSLKDELPKLRDRYLRTVQVFTSRGVENIQDIEACVELLRDERVRAEFHVKLRHFLATLDLVLPRPEGLAYVKDAKTLAFIQARARNRYRGDEVLIGKEVGEKIRKLIDDHIVSLGIDPKVEPVSLTDAEFEAKVSREVSPRAKASEMEHALRFHIRKHLDEDPVYFRKLSERLKAILQELEGQWDDLVTALRGLAEEVKEGRKADESGLDPVTQLPFRDILLQENGGAEPPDAETMRTVADLTVEMVDHIRQEIQMVNFWKTPAMQDALRKWIVRYLDGENSRRHELVPFERETKVADHLMELAKAKHAQLIR